MNSGKVFGLCLALLVPVLRAQDAWSVVAQNVTTQNLWSIAYGNRTLVAVGEQGAIIAYHYAAFGDQAWLPGASGTSAWLVGVGFGNGRFVVVGDHGTILTSDDNGATWTPRTSGTTTRLNAAAYGNGRWLIVGELGAVLTSTDGTTWTARPALGTGFLRALAFGQGRFLIGGSGGALFTTTDATTFTPVSIATTANIESAAISPNHFWIVGSGGLRATATQLGTWTFGSARPETFRGVTVRNADEASAVGENASDTFLVGGGAGAGIWAGNFLPLKFFATAVVQGESEIVAVGFGGTIATSRMNAPAYVVSDSPVIYGHDAHVRVLSGSDTSNFQWLLNDVEIPGATQTTLVIPNMTPAKTGTLTVRFSTPGGRSTIFGPQLRVVPAGQPEVREPDFVSALPTIPALVVPDPSGKLVAAGAFSVPLAGGATYGLVRLNADGSLDPTFRAGEGIPAGTSIAAMHLIFPDDARLRGSLYVRGSFTSIAGQPRAGLARLLRDGTLDTSFMPDPAIATLSLANSALDSNGALYVQTGATSASGGIIYRLSLNGQRDPGFPILENHRLLGVDSHARVLAVKYDLGGALGGVGRIVRYLANGGQDNTYVPTAVILGTLEQDDLATVMVADSGLYAQSRVGRIGITYFFKRYKPDGGLDPDYQAPPSLQATDFASRYRADGALWVIRRDNTAGYSATLHTPSGAPDPHAYATLPDLTRYSILAIAPDGSLIAAHQELTQQNLIHIRPITGTEKQLSNLSVRAFVGDDPLITGFVTTGGGTTSALLRAIGPGLDAFNVPDALRDPRLALVRNGTTVASNDDWDSAARFAEVGAFPLVPGTKDAALESGVGDGNYTAVVTSAQVAGRGTALAELYRIAGSSRVQRRFVNVSARATLNPAHPLIVGFTISGDAPMTVLVRAAGPALAAAPFNVGGALIDPQLQLFQGATALWENDNWTSADANAAGIADTARRAGAFAFPSNSRDSAMLVTLPPGSYTAVATGVNNGSGTALVEIYEAP